MRTKDGQSVSITGLENEFGRFEVFNIDVEEHHNYYAKGILVHNCTKQVSGDSAAATLGSIVSSEIASLANVTRRFETTADKSTFEISEPSVDSSIEHHASDNKTLSSKNLEDRSNVRESRDLKPEPADTVKQIKDKHPTIERASNYPASTNPITQRPPDVQTYNDPKFQSTEQRDAKVFPKVQAGVMVAADFIYQAKKTFFKSEKETPASKNQLNWGLGGVSDGLESHKEENGN